MMRRFTVMENQGGRCRLPGVRPCSWVDHARG
jgi:hypothetical protein